MTNSTTRHTTERRFRYLMHAVAAGVTLHLGLLVINLGVLQAREQQQAVDAQIESLRQFHAGADGVETRRLELQELLDQTEKQFAAAVTRIPETAQESEFLAQVSRLAKDSDLTLQEFRPGGITEHKTHRELEISLSASGGYRSLCEFLAGLEKLPRLCRVTSLTVDRDNAVSVEHYPVRMSVVVYFQPLALEQGDRNNGNA
jgi:Tfp pilus assembly protein PilO